MPADEPQREFEKYVAAASNDIEGPLGPCPSDRELFEYSSGGLDPARRDIIQAHLIGCAICRQTVLDAADFVQDGPKRGDLEPEWQRLQSRLSPGPGRPYRQHAVPVWMAAAATLLIVTGLTAAWALHFQRRADVEHTARLSAERQSASLQTEIAQLRHRDTVAPGSQHPLVNLAVYDLLPVDSISRAAGAAPARTIEANSGRPLLFLLSGAGQPQYPSYRIEILDTEGQRKWKDEDLHRDEQHNYSVLLSPGFLSPGDYVIQIAGVRQGSVTPVARYRLRLVTRK
jgi:hypothetical protein